MYFDQVFILLFIAIVLLSIFTFRYDPKRLEYDLDYSIPEPSKFLIGVLAILMLIFYVLVIAFAFNLYQLM